LLNTEEPSGGVIRSELPLRVTTPRAWAELALREPAVFLADHAVCEQQAALYALNLVAHYPEDDELVLKMTSLAAEEITHLRRVVRLLHRRSMKLSRRRPNPYVQGLHQRMRREREQDLKVDRLLVGALIEARSCERFTCLLETIGDGDPELSDLLRDLGPAERRHWEMFHDLASRETGRVELDACWERWLEWERELMAARGTVATVHG
jgi:tRNA-(ms[2]io[6]A)-hydroxylase